MTDETTPQSTRHHEARRADQSAQNHTHEAKAQEMNYYIPKPIGATWEPPFVNYGERGEAQIPLFPYDGIVFYQSDDTAAPQGPPNGSPCVICGEEITAYDSYGVGAHGRYHWHCIRREAATVSTAPSKPAQEAATPKRKHLVQSAGNWFEACRSHQKNGKSAEAVFAMENAYNHVENALAAAQRELTAATLRADNAERERDEAKKNEASAIRVADDAAEQSDTLYNQREAIQRHCTSLTSQLTAATAQITTLTKERDAAREIAQKYEDRFFSAHLELVEVKKEADRLKDGVMEIAHLGALSVIKRKLEAPAMAERLLKGESNSYMVDLMHQYMEVTRKLTKERDEANARWKEAREAWAKTENELMHTTRDLATAQRERDARAENVSAEEANELKDVLRTIVVSGPAFITSARELVAINDSLRAQLATAEARGAKDKALALRLVSLAIDASNALAQIEHKFERAGGIWTVASQGVELGHMSWASNVENAINSLRGSLAAMKSDEKPTEAGK